MISDHTAADPDDDHTAADPDDQDGESGSDRGANLLSLHDNFLRAWPAFAASPASALITRVNPLPPLLIYHLISVDNSTTPTPLTMSILNLRKIKGTSS